MHPCASDVPVKGMYTDKSPPLLDFPNGGFSAVWRTIRMENQSIMEVTNTKHRHYIETKVCKFYDNATFSITNCASFS